MQSTLFIQKLVRFLFGEWKEETQKQAPAMQPAKVFEPKAQPRATEAMLQMEAYLGNEYDFRFNRLTEETEYRMRKEKRSSFRVVGQRELNSFCIAARKEGMFPDLFFPKILPNFIPFISLWMSCRSGMGRIGWKPWPVACRGRRCG